MDISISNFNNWYTRTSEIDEGRWLKAAMRHAMGELLASGVTTVVDIQGATAHPEMWLDELVESGL